MVKKLLTATIFLSIVGGSLVASRKSDADVLIRVGRTATDRVSLALPDRSKLAGPLAKLPLLEWANLEDKIRARYRTDALVAQANVGIEVNGEDVKLTGRVETPAQRDRAIELAKSTLGVKTVTAEIATPESP